MKVFISYRRSDTQDFAGRLADKLRATRGITELFFDVDAIGAGDDFQHRIETAMRQCEAALIVIGPSWLTTGTDGRPRLFDDADFVRLEVREALTSRSRVIPVLVNGAAMPGADLLPPDLQPLVKINAVSVRHGDFQRDADHLVNAIFQRKPPGSFGRFLQRNPVLASMLRAAAGVATALLALLIGLAIFQFTNPDSLSLGDYIGAGGLFWVVTLTVLAGAATPWLIRKAMGIR